MFTHKHWISKNETHDDDDDDEKEKQINWVLLSCNGGRVTATAGDFYHFYVVPL